MKFSAKAWKKWMAAKPGYGMCVICGYHPEGDLEEPTHGPLRFWDSDDGWRIGSLCRWCAEDDLDAKPQPDDYAYRTTNGVCDHEETDEDPILAL